MTAFLLTWTEAGWAHENVLRLVQELHASGGAEEPWRIAAYKMAKAGDRVWVLQQGKGEKGIFGAGHITGSPIRGDAGNGKTQFMAPVSFEHLVDPRREFLIRERDVSEVLTIQQVRARASGYPIDDSQSSVLEAMLAARYAEAGAVSREWSDTELHAIVASYFVMLDAEVKNEPYSKTAHRKMLLDQLNRSPGAIERKHQNVSAVLQLLGVPWISGYKPLGNLQSALVAAVEAKLEGSIAVLDEVLLPGGPANALRFVPPPVSRNTPADRPLSSLIRKYDPAARDAANRRLGRVGEEFIFKFEQLRLTEGGRGDLAERVKWVSDAVGDGFGYDIESFSLEGVPIFIEVKTTRGPISTPFFVTENERKVAGEKGPAYLIYRLFGFGSEPQVYKISGPMETELMLEPTAYRASFDTKKQGSKGLDNS